MSGPTLDDVIRGILRREGSAYVDDPDDSGGPTRYGITLETARRLGLDLDHDGDVDADDVRLIDEATAYRAVRDLYHVRPGIDRLDALWHPVVTDTAVHSGPARAVKLLQVAMNKAVREGRLSGSQVEVDGVIGPATIAASGRFAAEHGRLAVDAYGWHRRGFLLALAERRPKDRRYVRTRRGGKGGWIVRAEEFMRDRYRLSEREFARITEGWG